MLETALAWILKLILEWLLEKAVTQAKIAHDQIVLDKERNETNEANVKAYEGAKTREDRRRAALALLNREHP